MHRNGDPRRVYLPLGVERVVIHDRLPDEVRCHVRVKRNDARFLEYDMTVYGVDGHELVDACGVTCKIIGGAHEHEDDRLYDGCYEYRFVLDAGFDETHERNRDLRTCVVVGSPGATTDGLIRRLEAEGLEVVHRHDASWFGADGRARLGEALASMPLDRRCVVVYVPDEGRSSGLDAWGEAKLPDSTQGLLNLCQAILDREACPRLVVVTRAAMIREGDDDACLEHSALVGSCACSPTRAPRCSPASSMCPGEAVPPIWTPWLGS